MTTQLSTIQAVAKQALSLTVSFQDPTTAAFSLTGKTVQIRFEPPFDAAILLLDGAGLAVNYGAGTLTLSLPANALTGLGDGRWRVTLLDANGGTEFRQDGLLQVAQSGTDPTVETVVVVGDPTGSVGAEAARAETAEAARLQKANNLSDVADAGASRLNLHVAQLAVCQVAATSNVALTGLQTIDGYTTLAGDLVLCTGQSTGSQNGPWLAASGAWTRPHEYATTASVVAGRTVSVVNGTVNGPSQWILKTAGTVTVDTTATTWAPNVAPSVVTARAVAGAPTTGTWTTNQSIVDSNGDVWTCTAGGTPGAWQEGAGVANASSPLYVSNYVTTVDGTTVNTTGFQAAITAAIAQNRPLVVGYTAQPYVLGTVSVTGTITMIFAPDVVIIPDPAAVQPVIVSVRMPGSTDGTAIIAPKFLGGPWTIDMTAQTYNGPNTTEAMQVIGNVQDCYIENLTGKAIPAPAGNTINVHQNQGGFRPLRLVTNNIKSRNVQGVGSSAVQLQAGADCVCYACDGDGGVPFRMEGHAATGGAAPQIDNCWGIGGHLSSESGFANVGAYAVIHDTGYLRNSGAKHFRVEAGYGFYATYDTTAVPLDGVVFEDFQVSGGGALQEGAPNGVLQVSTKCVARDCLVESPTASGITYSPGWLYENCWVVSAGSNGIVPAQPPSVPVGSMTKFVGGGALFCTGSGLVGGASQFVTLDAFEAHDNPANLGLSGAAPGDLTANESGIETDATGWVAVGATVRAQSTLWAVDGTHSLELAYGQSGNNARTAGTGTGAHVCTPGELLYLECWGRPGAGITPRNFYLQVRFYDSSGTQIGADLNAGIATTMNTTAAGNINGFVKHASQLTAPALAVFYTTFIVIAAGATVGDKFYFDRVYAGQAAGVVTQAYGVTVNSGTTVVAGLTTTLTNNGAGAYTGAGTFSGPPAGAIVGTSDTQTLSNKTLVAPTVSGGLLYAGNAVTVASNAATAPVTARMTTVTNNAAAAVTITITTTGAVDGQLLMVRFYDFSAAAQTLTWTNTENSAVSVPTTSNGSTTLPLTLGFQYNALTSKWRCIASV